MFRPRNKLFHLLLYQLHMQEGSCTLQSSGATSRGLCDPNLRLQRIHHYYQIPNFFHCWDWRLCSTAGALSPRHCLRRQGSVAMPGEEFRRHVSHRFFVCISDINCTSKIGDPLVDLVSSPLKLAKVLQYKSVDFKPLF